jgi:HPt (histidine-containing phosphotransfer) domain-containing protein
MLDLTNAEAIADGDRVFIKELLKIFLKNAPDHRLSIRHNFEDENFYELGQAVHKLKSATAILGATEFGVILKEVELDCKESNCTAKSVEPKYFKILEQLELVVEAVSTELSGR